MADCSHGRSPRAGQYQHVRVFVRLQVEKQPAQFLVQRCVDCIQGLLAIQGRRQNAPLPREPDMSIAGRIDHHAHGTSC